ncbi:MAG TPA: tetratricopeptide repeat protein [Rhizomicrobium sp.]|nr:tetratricopeptide repeat protein [Rhizomicrobium sp.]
MRKRPSFLPLAALATALLLGACTTKPAADAETPIESLPPSQAADAYGHYLSAHLAASEHDIADAAVLYQAGLKDDPGNADLLNRAFLYTAAAGDADTAAQLAAQVVAGSPDDRAARLALAVDAIRHNDFAGARKQITLSAKGPFTTLTLSLVDAWAAAALGDNATAIEDLKQVPLQGGTDSLAAYHRALILDLTGDNAGADAAYKQAMPDKGPGPRVVDAYGRFLERTGRKADAEAFYDKLGDDESLAPIIAEAKERMAAGKLPERLVPSFNDGAAESLFGIASSLTDATSADIAILYLRFALSMSPNLDLAKIVLADRFESLQKYDDAIDVYRTVNVDSPYAPAAAVQVAIDETRVNQTKKAIEDLEMLTKAIPDDVSAWTALGDAYRSSERFPDAATAYDNAIKAVGTPAAKDWPLFYARAVSEERANRWDDAEKDLQLALKLSPDQPQVLNYLGYSWVDRGRNLPQALAMLEKARALSPFDGYIVDSVGWAYFKVGRYSDAAKTLEDAVLLVPGDPTINDHLGDAYWRVGRKLDAHFQWSHALAFGPTDDDKPKIEKKLEVGLAPAAKIALPAKKHSG